MYDNIIDAIERIDFDRNVWTWLRTRAGLAAMPRHDTPRAHIAWLRRKAKRAAGLAPKQLST